MALEGGCACSAIRYKLKAEPMIVQACHCRDCQRLSGSAFALNMWIEAKHFEVSGAKPQGVKLKGGSGQTHEVFFCGNCGTKLWGVYHAAPGENRFVAAGTLDNPDLVKPAAHIYTRSKQPWVTLAPETPSFDDIYDMKEFWPVESLKRFKENM